MRTKSWSEIRDENRRARIESYAGMTDAELTGRALRHELEQGAGGHHYGADSPNYYREEIRRRQAAQAFEQVAA